MKQKILYLMNLDWYWIKQRPQYIAEGLAENNEVYVAYKHSYKRNHLQKNKSKSNVKLTPIYTIPHSLQKNKNMKKIGDYILHNKIRKMIKSLQPDVIYFSSIFPIEIIPETFKGKVIYDCMDDYSVLEKTFNEEEERNLIERSTDVLVSSQNLKKVLINRYGEKISSKLFLVRNGFNQSAGHHINQSKVSCNNKNTISYIGTVSEWLDFSVLEESLKRYNNLEYKIIGPIDKDIELPTNPRIHFLGTIEHNKLYEYIKEDSALIMPFKLNRIVESVDPVKLYEYINFDKNIISIKYPEIGRFQDYVYFYKDSDEFCTQVGKVLKGSGVKYSEKKRIKFLKSNSWNSRVQKIEKILNP